MYNAQETGILKLIFIELGEVLKLVLIIKVQWMRDFNLELQTLKLGAF